MSKSFNHGRFLSSAQLLVKPLMQIILRNSTVIFKANRILISVLVVQGSQFWYHKCSVYWTEGRLLRSKNGVVYILSFITWTYWNNGMAVTLPLNRIPSFFYLSTLKYNLDRNEVFSAVLVYLIGHVSCRSLIFILDWSLTELLMTLDEGSGCEKHANSWNANIFCWILRTGYDDLT